MNCEQARQLFDAYLDGELSASLATELGAHRLRCANCRRALALMEVSGHIIGSDREARTLPSTFSDRLLSCVDNDGRRRWIRFRRALYVAGPLAAAAVVVLAFAGFFDGRGESKVAGITEEVRRESSGAPELFGGSAQGVDAGAGAQAGEHGLLEFIEQAQRNMADKRRSSESLQQMLDQTIEEALDQLENAEVPTGGEDASPDKNGSPAGQLPAGEDGGDLPVRKKKDRSSKTNEVEDL